MQQPTSNRKAGCGKPARPVWREGRHGHRAVPTPIASIALGTEPDLKLKPGEWTQVSLELRGTKASLKVGDFAKTYEHASFSRAKTNLSVGFAFGSVSVKGVTVEK